MCWCRPPSRALSLGIAPEIKFAADSLLEEAGFEPSVPLRLARSGTSVAVSWVFAAGLGLVTAWARQAREIVFDGRGVTRTTTADRPAPSAPRC
jgi:hypothetical protein